MAKYKAGDVLTITESFKLDGAQFAEGEHYEVVYVRNNEYRLKNLDTQRSWFVHQNMFDVEERVKRVEPKYNVGDTLEIVEDFISQCAPYRKGEKYVVKSLDSNRYTYSLVRKGGSEVTWSASVFMFDGQENVKLVKTMFKVGDVVEVSPRAADGQQGTIYGPVAWSDFHSPVKAKIISVAPFGTGTYEVDPYGFSSWQTVEEQYLTLVKDEEENHFKVGDTVYLLEGAHSSDDALGSTPESLIANLRACEASFDGAWELEAVADFEGDVFIAQDGQGVYVLEQFLTKEKPKANRPLEERLEEFRQELTNSVEQIITPPKVDTVEVSKLLEANEFLGHIEQDFLMELVNLAQRLK